MTNLLHLYTKLDSRRVDRRNSPNSDCVGVLELIVFQAHHLDCVGVLFKTLTKLYPKQWQITESYTIFGVIWCRGMIR